MHPGTGRVRFDDGEPVRSGSIEVRLISSSDRYASRIGERGTFQLADADGDTGIPPGEYEAVIVQIVLTEDLALDQHQHGRTVPRRYADYHSSDLRVSIDDNASDSIEVVLEAGDAAR